jgi:hypothetical protein
MTGTWNSVQLAVGHLCAALGSPTFEGDIGCGDTFENPWRSWSDNASFRVSNAQRLGAQWR